MLIKQKIYEKNSVLTPTNYGINTPFLFTHYSQKIPDTASSVLFFLQCVLFFIAKKDNLAKAERQSAKEVVKALIDGLWALILPVFILVGLRSGKFTPTEAGVIAAVYALVIGLFVYKELKINMLMDCLVSAAKSSSVSRSSYGFILDDDCCKCSGYCNRYSCTIYQSSDTVNVYYLYNRFISRNFYGCNSYDYDFNTCFTAGCKSCRN